MKLTYTFGYYLIITIIISLTMHAHGQGPVKNYNTEWKKVDELVGKGLDKDALEQIKSIYQLAKKEKQEAQLIKATVYMIHVQNENREQNLAMSIGELEKEQNEVTGPAKAILTSLIANQYLSYYHTVRWQLYNRTTTTSFDKADVATWGIEDFERKIGDLYLLSIHNEDLLKKTPLEPFDALIIKGNVRKLRPTLFDLLAFEALEYFSSSALDVPIAAYSFEINAASAFDPAADFIHRKFEKRDSSALEYQALLLYQKLVAFHLEDPSPDALIDVDLARIQYVRQKSVHPDKDSLYYMAINHVAEQYQSIPAAAQAWYLKAAWLHERADRFQAGKDSTVRYENVQAVAICEKISSENPDTEGGINAHNLLNMIRQMQLGVTLERVNEPQKPFRALLNFKNIPLMHFRLIKADAAAIANYERDDYQNKWEVLTRTPAMRTWTQALPDTRDYQQHSTEVKVDGLETGDYILLAGTDSGFKDGTTMMAARLFHVSNLSYVQMSDRYFVVNRDNGQPVVDASVQIWKRMYNPNSRKNELSKGALLKTNANGQFLIPRDPKRDDRYELLPEIIHNNDRLFLRETRQVYSGAFDNNYGESDPEDKVDEVYLFTDRAIYRPGQAVYYKGIARKGTQILKDRKYEIEVMLEDPNAEDIHTTTHKVNEYGSFSGTFLLPQNGLTGDFTISTKYSQVRFKVEEYKRPKFEVVFDTLKNNYKVNDTIRISGTATTYAGNAINEAQVKYRVMRKPRVIYAWWKRMPPMQGPAEIAHGETTTDASGKFKVDFTAIPDLRLSPNSDPIFDYAIHADITDLNGETRSNEITISATYKSFILKSDIPQKTKATEFKSLAVRSENLSGRPIATDATISFIRITPENRLIRERYWPRPDVFVMNKAEYIKVFPHDEYDAETDMENWQSSGAPVVKSVKLGPEPTIPTTDLNLMPGFYKISILARNAANEEVSDIRYIQLTAPQKALPYPAYLWVEGTSPIEPGQKTTLQLGTTADRVFLIRDLDKKEEDTFSFTSLDKQIATFEFKATENDRGGYFAQYLFVKHNRIHRHVETISVPWTNKQLKITYETFRDKTLPGSKETWKINISGLQKERVASEMLGSMYDASLDQLYMHQWDKPQIWHTQRFYLDKSSDLNFSFFSAEVKYGAGMDFKSLNRTFDQLQNPGRISMQLGGRVAGVTIRGQARERKTALAGAAVQVSMAAPSPDDAALNEVVVVGYGQLRRAPQPPSAPSPRRNFNETAFFLPNLKTDSDGNITFSFTLPESLTRWKFQALAHTKDLAFGYSSKEIITQKELMVQPNAPRFLREGDRLNFPVKIANLTGRELKGTATLQLTNAETNETLDEKFGNHSPAKAFTVAARQSDVVFFEIQVAKGFTGVLTWRATAQSDDLSDGEENVLPVLPNRMLVTESLPIFSRGNGDRLFTFEKLKKSGSSATLQHQSLTVEYTNNPAWYAVQALPYLMEYPYECAEQTWSRYYANTLAAHIVRSSPRVAQVFSHWKTLDTTALQSNLSKNQELKALLLEETPWVLAAKSENIQKQNIALLFDVVKMSNEQARSMQKLREMQSTNGGFPWFKGGPDDRYITQYIVTSIGHLKKINAFSPEQEREVTLILDKAIPYLDARLQEDYRQLIRDKADLTKYIPGPYDIQYLYMRSFFPYKGIPATTSDAYPFYYRRAKETWISHSKMLQGMIALVLHRSSDIHTASSILESLSQKAIHNEELGMYWKEANRSWWWHEAPIERQALLIEAFEEVGKDASIVNDLKTWLLKNKQTNNWESTKATAEACYALLTKGNYWLAESPATTIRLGGTEIKPKTDATEAGTGYFKQTLNASEVKPSLADIRVLVQAPASAASLPAWGSVYWQYFEDLDKITFAETPLKLSKQLFVETNTDSGPMLTPVREGSVVKVGDKIKVRIELRVDRDIEYVHMKDMRASGLEPVNVLSGYRWQGGLGYYESTRDASTNFFFSALRKGTYVFEYPLFITHEGDFSNGITTIQCMYAPEFTAHSEGVRLKVLPNK
ncbi:MAG: alpha-2-macroglobulin [Dyadobacter sp.]|uniref:alpha-2-macroglobulin family protein n=1 Tax=Dyadobacter sp. TaxID=1914288 RepID=UPI001B1C874A|nr:alpha-2-macroglobulin family protein [Dyadobacter sp.]MBO9616635.1 alpha-2-macroglobulin [Dyadobacter sp.]